MVFFTCNACGASLKKNQVEKHYQNECPTCEVLSCMDCGQDFYGDAYANHTKCISEAEKYQGALFKESGKGGPGKGERKQQEWLEQVKQSVSGAKVSPKVAGLLERIADYPNIPRKRTKFENFIRNSFNIRDQKTLTQLWDAFSGATKKSGAHEVTTEKAVAEKQMSDVQAEELTKTDRKDTEPVPTKKRKKHKEKVEHSDASDAGDIINASRDTDLGDDGGSNEMPKRKKKRQKTEPTANDVEPRSAAGAVEVEVDDPPAIKKVKKRTQKADEAANLTDESVIMEGVNDEEMPAMKQAKKKKRKQESGSAQEGVLRKKRKHVAELGSDAEEEAVIQAQKQKGCKISEDGDLELSNGILQAVIKKHKKKKHKHQKV